MRHVLLAIFLGLSACSSAPPARPVETKTTGVTIVGWSLVDQGPIPIEGVLRQGARDVKRFDTKARPDGTTVYVEPGPYEVEVTHRFAGDRAIPASGLERVDARGGEIVRCEVVVDDREDGSR